MIIDMHSHYFPLAALDRLPESTLRAAGVSRDATAVTLGGHAFPADDRLFDLERQLDDMRAVGLDARTLLPPPFTFLYEIPADAGRAWTRAVNDAISAAARGHPDQLFGFAIVPLQDVHAAVAELERAIGDLGLVGVEIATSVAGSPLDDAQLDPFWKRCEDLRVPILIHPHYVSGADRMGSYHLRNLIGNPSETALAAARLLFGGVPERFPELRIILSHGGGSLPHLLGRIHHGFMVRPECRVNASQPLSAVSRFYYDTIVFDPRALRYVNDIVGSSRIVLGSDYPFDMSEPDPATFVRGSGLTAQETEAILHAGHRLMSSIERG